MQLDIKFMISCYFTIRTHFHCSYLNAIQTMCPHILRYLTTAVITNKRRRTVLKDLVKIIQQESYTYKDPITEFLECLYVNFDFDGAQQKLRECETVSRSTFWIFKKFWWSQWYHIGFVTHSPLPLSSKYSSILWSNSVLRNVFNSSVYFTFTLSMFVLQVLMNDFFLVACLDDFIENARLFIFETFCRIHQCISIK